MSERTQTLAGDPPASTVDRASAADLQIALAALLAGSGWLFSIQALKELPPLFFIGSRFVVSGILIGSFFGVTAWRKAELPWRSLMVASAAMSCAMVAWILGLKETGHAGVAAFITATGNLMVPFVGFALFRWPIASSFWWSFPIALTGLGLLFLNSGPHVDQSDFLFVISAVAWAVSIAIVRNGSLVSHAGRMAAAQLLLTGLMILPVSFLTEHVPASLPSAKSLGWFAASVLLSTCLRFVLQFDGQSRATPARAAVLMAFEPAWAMLFALIFLGSSVTVVQAAGCAVIFLAIAREALARRPAQKH